MDRRPRCHACDEPLRGAPAGFGTLLFPRGDEVEEERLPLCKRCAIAVGAAAHARFVVEDEDDG